MNCPSTAVVDVRLGRKRFSISGSLLSLLMLLLALVMLVTQTSARPQTANETATHNNNFARLQQQKSDANYNDDSSVELAFDAGDEYADVDNVEWHHVKIVDGIMHEDHPIIMYKEDFVSEDYDPSQHTPTTTTTTNGNTETHTTQQHSRRKYKNIKRPNRLNRNDTGADNDTDTVIAAATSSSDSFSADSSKISKEKYHALKPEKIYFDILPQSPVVLTDDASSNDSKFEPSRIHVEVISLLDEEQQEQAKHDYDATKSSSAQQEQGQGQQSKQLLNKHPKKYHHHEHKQRSRRDLTAVGQEKEEQHQADEHKLHKRTPHYTYERQGPNSFDVYAKHLMNYWTQKHPVAGNRWNGIDGDVPPFVDFDNRFGGEDNTDRVVWGVSKKITRPVNRPPATRRPAPAQPNFPPLMHNSNPEDADFSPFTTRPQSNFITNNNNNNNRRPASATRPPAQQPQFPSIFHNSNPNDADFSVFTKRPPTTARPAPNNAISTGGGASSSSSPSSSSSSSSPSSSSSAAISQCVWAIVNCCSTSNTNIRYECFGRLGCPGAFWNLNPCADDVKDKVLEFVDRQFQ